MPWLLRVGKETSLRRSGEGWPDKGNSKCKGLEEGRGLLCARYRRNGSIGAGRLGLAGTREKTNYKMF